MRKFLISVLVIILFQVAFGQKQKLGFNLAVGKIYYQTMHSSTNIELQNENGPKVNMDFTASGEVAFTITELKGNIYNITACFRQISSLTKLPFIGHEGFNSDEKNEMDTFSNISKAIINKQFFIKMTTLGKIVEVKNIGSIVKHALEKFPKLSIEKRLEFKGQFTQSFGEDVFKHNFEMITAIYPNNPVAKGDTWTIRREIKSRPKEAYVSIYELKGKFGSYNLIVGNGNIETPKEDDYKPINGMLIKHNQTETVSSSFQVDSKTGWIIDAKIKDVISGNTEMKPNPKLPKGMTQKMSVLMELMYSSK